MAGKKKEVSLQMAVTNQEQWDEMLAIKGLNVVDVYQQWCGPCRAVVSLFRKVKNELGDDLLHFATAEADTVDALEKYRGKCEPTFLFYGGGELVAFLRGANAPVLQKMVVEELAKEKKVLEQGAERRVVKDDGPKEQEEEAEAIGHQHSEEDVLVPASKSYTVAIIKPDAVAHGKANEIIMKVQEEGFEILAHEERTLSEAEARDFYQHKAAEPYFEELVQFMSSGPCHVLLVSNQEGSDDVIPAWREFIGPANTEEAKRDKPESLRAQYGTEAVFNAVHGSEDQDRASRELAFFFPNFRTTSTLDHSGTEESRVERTLAIIRPDAAREKRDEILLHVQEAGFTVAMQKEVMLTEDMVRQFYSHHHQEKDYFPALLQHMTSGPVLALGLVRIGAVQRWREMLGPKNVTQAKEEEPASLRAQFAVENDPINQIHGSGSVEEAEREIEFFFPPEHTLAVIKPDALEEHKEEILEHIQKAGFTISRAKETIMSTEMAEEFYKEHREKPFFGQLVEFMTRGPCLLMALTKENAVEDWRAMMGPTDPSQAKEEAPDSLRARFATDILQNSVHGSSNSKHANEKIRIVFGSIQSEAGIPGDGEATTPPQDPGRESSREEDVEEMKIIESDSSPVEPDDEEPSGPGPAGGEDQSEPSSQHPQEEAEAALEQEAESAAETGSGIPPQEVTPSSEHSEDPQNSQERASTHSRNSDTHSSGREGKQSPDPDQSEP